jgi:hypothetical protein
MPTTGQRSWNQPDLAWEFLDENLRPIADDLVRVCGGYDGVLAGFCGRRLVDDESRETLEALQLKIKDLAKNEGLNQAVTERRDLKFDGTSASSLRNAASSLRPPVWDAERDALLKAGMPDHMLRKLIKHVDRSFKAFDKPRTRHDRALVRAGTGDLASCDLPLASLADRLDVARCIEIGASDRGQVSRRHSIARRQQINREAALVHSLVVVLVNTGATSVDVFAGSYALAVSLLIGYEAY